MNREELIDELRSILLRLEIIGQEIDSLEQNHSIKQAFKLVGVASTAVDESITFLKD